MGLPRPEFNLPHHEDALRGLKVARDVGSA